MDYFEDVVSEYLRADRSLFINTQCCIQLNEGKNPDTSGPHWYCDAIAADFRAKQIYLCEITFSDPPSPLLKRLSQWGDNWAGVRAALVRDSKLPEDWHVRPWIFAPAKLVHSVVAHVTKLTEGSLPVPKITPLEFVVPWEYCSWNREGEKNKPDSIPESMR